MPNQTPMQQNPSAKSGGRPSGMPETPGTGTQKTNDHVYAIVSVLYHAMQGVEACEKYVNDAREAGDGELEQFFTSSRSDQQARAEQAKSLLLDRLEDEEEDEYDAADDQSGQSSDEDDEDE